MKIYNQTNVVMTTNKTLITRAEFLIISGSKSHPLHKKAVMLHEKGLTTYYVNN